MQTKLIGRQHLETDQKVRILKKRKTRSITLVGRRWFDRINGNTYHSTLIIVNGVALYRTGMAYGYGSQWEYTGFEWLIKVGLVKINRNDNGSWKESPWSYCEDRGIEYVTECVDVSRQRDLT